MEPGFKGRFDISTERSVHTANVKPLLSAELLIDISMSFDAVILIIILNNAQKTCLENQRFRDGVHPP